jgi:hypothetical protein
MHDPADAKRDAQRDAQRAGLCADCAYSRRMRNDRGSTFYLCERSKSDAAFPKYPRLPVRACAGYEAKEG